MSEKGLSIPCPKHDPAGCLHSRTPKLPTADGQREDEIGNRGLRKPAKVIPRRIPGTATKVLTAKEVCTVSTLPPIYSQSPHYRGERPGAMLVLSPDVPKPQAASRTHVWIGPVIVSETVTSARKSGV